MDDWFMTVDGGVYWVGPGPEPSCDHPDVVTEIDTHTAPFNYGITKCEMCGKPLRESYVRAGVRVYVGE